jgi:membrane-bound metal-dependent hydrolase YbcI (DUF457 family)
MAVRHLTHEAIGGAAALAACTAVQTGPLLAAGAFCASLFRSRLPDLDQPGARIHRRTRLERRSFSAATVGSVLRVPVTIFARLAEHRGATHWLVTGAAVTIALTLASAAVWSRFGLPVAIGIGCGYGAHLLADACTPHSAPLFGPFRARRVHLLPSGHRIVTGSLGDLLILIAAMLTAAALGVAMTQHA